MRPVDWNYIGIMRNADDKVGYMNEVILANFYVCVPLKTVLVKIKPKPYSLTILNFLLA